MSRVQLGIFDKEEEYARKLGAYIMTKAGDSLEPYVFTDEESFLEAAAKLDFALVPEDFTQALENGRVARLVERADGQGGLQIEKYQSMPGLVSQVMGLFSIEQRSTGTGEKKMICVCSPVHHELQMLFSLCLAKEMSNRDKVLYVNLSESSGFSRLFGQEGKDLEDLLAVVGRPGLVLENFISQVQGVQVILPPRRPEVLWEVTKPVFEEFLKLLEGSRFDTIVFDVGGSFPGVYSLFEKSSRILALTREGFLCEKVYEEWRENLCFHLGEDSGKSEERVVLSLTGGGLRDSDFLLEELYRGNIGDFIRERVVEVAG